MKGKVRGSICVAICLVVLMVVSTGWADDFKFSVHPRVNIYTDVELETDEGIEVRAGYKSLFLFGSYDLTSLRLHGQRAGDIELFGVGVGMELPIWVGDATKLSVSGQLGYYHPESTLPDEIKNGYNEAMWYEVRSRYLRLGVDEFYADGEKPWDRVVGFDYKVGDAIGGAVSLHFSRVIVKNLTAGLDVGYRYLKLPEAYYARGRMDNGTIMHNWMEWHQERDFSGAVVGFNLTYRF